MADTFELPADLAEKALEIVEIARNSGKVKKGMNEVTKVVERGQAKLVLVANDISPPEIAMHLPLLCTEKKVYFIKAGTKKDIGSASGLDIPTAAVAVVDEGNAKKQLAELIGKKK